MEARVRWSGLVLAFIVGTLTCTAGVAWQDTMFSAGNAYERFMGRWSRQLAFADGSFDRTLSLLVLNFIPDRSKALREMVRVTRSGGTVAAATWEYGDGMEMLRVFRDEAIALTPGMDRRDEKHMPVSRTGELATLWRPHGLRDIAEQGLTIPMRFASFDDYWRPFLEKQGPAGDYVATLSEAQREELRVRLRRRLLGDGPDRPIALTARALAVRGTVP